MKNKRKFGLISYENIQKKIFCGYSSCIVNESLIIGLLHCVICAFVLNKRKNKMKNLCGKKLKKFKEKTFFFYLLNI